MVSYNKYAIALLLSTGSAQSNHAEQVAADHKKYFRVPPQDKGSREGPTSNNPVEVSVSDLLFDTLVFKRSIWNKS